MSRLVGASEAIREAVPPELVPLFWLLTAFGSAKILMIVLSLAYWNWEDRREELLTVIAVAFVAVAVTLSLKHWFALPRPPAEVYRYPIEPSSHGFPSGHAIAATVVYGGALVATEQYRDYRKTLAVGGFAVAIGLSRVVLGVHYLGDVLAGFAVGLAALGVVALAVRVERGATITFLVAAAFSVPAAVVAGGDPDVALALGGSLGGAAGSLWAEVRAFRTVAERAVFNAAAVAFVVLGLAAEELAEAILPAAVTVNFALAFGIVALPAGFASLRKTVAAGTGPTHR